MGIDVMVATRRRKFDKNRFVREDLRGVSEVTRTMETPDGAVVVHFEVGVWTIANIRSIFRTQDYTITEYDAIGGRENMKYMVAEYDPDGKLSDWT